METDSPEELWTPDPAVARVSSIAQFARFVREQRIAEVDELDYASLHGWSIGDLDAFWAAAAEFLGVRFHAAPHAALGSSAMPGTVLSPVSASVSCCVCTGCGDEMVSCDPRGPLAMRGA